SDVCSSDLGRPLNWQHNWKVRAAIGARRSFPNICNATMRHWLNVGYCWKLSGPTANGYCAYAMRRRPVTPVTRVTAVTGVTDTAIPGVSRHCRHNRHQRHVRHWRHEFETIGGPVRSEEHTSELQSRFDLVCRLLLAK